MFFHEIQIGDLVKVHTSWGTGQIVEGVVTGKEEDAKNGQDIVDYSVDGERYEHWCYLWQVLDFSKKEEK